MMTLLPFEKFLRRNVIYFCLGLVILLPIARNGPLLSMDLENVKLWGASLLFVLTVRIDSTVTLSPGYQGVRFLLVVLCAITVAAIALSSHHRISLECSRSFFTSVLLFFIFSRLMDENFRKLFNATLLLITFGACGLAVIQFVVIKYHLSNSFLLGLIPHETKTVFWESHGVPMGQGIRVPSFFYHSNGFGHFLAIVFGFHFSMLLHSKSAANQSLFGLATLSVLCASLLTLSRGSVVVIAFEFILILYLSRNSMNRKNLAWAGILMLLALFYLLGKDLSIFLDRFVTSGLANRDINWKYALDLLPGYALFGAGPGVAPHLMLTRYPFTFEYLMQMLFDLQVLGKINYYISHPHNFLLNTMLETGIFAVVLYGLLLWVFIKQGFRIIIRCDQSSTKALAIGVTVPIIGCLIRGLVESYVLFNSKDVGFLVSFYFALVLYLGTFHQVGSSSGIPSQKQPDTFT